MMMCLCRRCRSCVNSDVVGDLEGGRSDLLNVLQFDALCQLHQGHTTVDPVNIEDSEIGDNSANTVHCSLRKTTLLNDLGVAVLVKVIGNDDDLRE